MTDVVPFRGRPRPKKDVSAYVGMIVFLGGWAMMFACLFFAYALVRFKSATWPPVGELRLPIALPALNTLIILVSSFALVMGLRAVREARPKALLRWLIIGIGTGLVFFGLQLVVWVRMWNAGLQPSSGIYGSVFYALTWFHALHVLVGVGGLLTLLPRAARGAFTVQHHTAVRTWGMFWHFVDVVWVLMFVTVYVL